MNPQIGGTMANSLKLAALLSLLLLTACFKTELGGAVPGASVTITELRSGAVAQSGLVSRDFQDFIDDEGQDKWDSLNDLGRQINLGNFFPDKNNFNKSTLYLVTVSGGADMDADGDGLEDEDYTPVAGSWHAIMRGSQLRKSGYVVSVITEALYQAVLDDIDGFSDAQLMSRLNQLSQDVLADVNNNGVVKYSDAVYWSVLFHKEFYLLNPDNLQALAVAIASGDEDDIRDKALQLAGVDGTDPQQYFTDNISMPIVQAKCVNCHTVNGIAPNSGARLIVVTNNNNNHLSKNNQAFIDLQAKLAPQDLSNYVTSKVTGNLNHGGGRQIAPNSQDLQNLETYLNLLE
jgi:hypothetical protein